MREREAKLRRAKGRGGGSASARGAAPSPAAELKQEEKVFCKGLSDVCPRCGADNFRGADDQTEHLEICNDVSKIQVRAQFMCVYHISLLINS